MTPNFSSPTTRSRPKPLRFRSQPTQPNPPNQLQRNRHPPNRAKRSKRLPKRPQICPRPPQNRHPPKKRSLSKNRLSLVPKSRTRFGSSPPGTRVTSVREPMPPIRFPALPPTMTPFRWHRSSTPPTSPPKPTFFSTSPKRRSIPFRSERESLPPKSSTIWNTESSISRLLWRSF